MGSDCMLADDEPCPRSKTGKPEDFQGSCTGCVYLQYICDDPYAVELITDDYMFMF